MVLVAVGQLCSTASMSHNLAACQRLIAKSAAAGAKALFLPEASDYIAGSSTESISLCLPAFQSPFVLGLQDSAKQSKLHVSVGIHEPTTPPSKRIRNTLIWISSDGDIVHRYQKLHLFDADLRQTGGPRIKESDSTEPGSAIEPPYEGLRSDGFGKIGSLICFDIRFPEPSLSLQQQGSDVILYPSAFTVPTGKAHWEVLLRARANETQCWIIAAAQCGRHNEKRVSYGASMVVDPRGAVRGRLSNVEDEAEEKLRDGAGKGSIGSRDEDLLLVDIDTQENEDARRRIPLLRRWDVYPRM